MSKSRVVAVITSTRKTNEPDNLVAFGSKIHTRKLSGNHLKVWKTGEWSNYKMPQGATAPFAAFLVSWAVAT